MTAYGILKNEIKDNFSQIKNEVIHDGKITDFAFRIYCYISSKPSTWIVNQNQIAKHYGKSLRTVQRAFTQLKKFDYINIHPERNDKGQLWYQYTILNHMTVVSHGTESPIRQMSTRHSTTGGEMSYHINKEYSNTKEDSNNDKNKDDYFGNQQVNDLFCEYLKLRKEMKLKTSEQALNTLINKLKPHNDADKIDMLNNAIVGNWKSVYPPGNSKLNKKTIGSSNNPYTVEQKQELSEDEQNRINEILNKL